MVTFITIFHLKKLRIRQVKKETFLRETRITLLDDRTQKTFRRPQSSMTLTFVRPQTKWRLLSTFWKLKPSHNSRFWSSKRNCKIGCQMPFPNVGPPPSIFRVFVRWRSKPAKLKIIHWPFQTFQFLLTLWSSHNTLHMKGTWKKLNPRQMIFFKIDAVEFFLKIWPQNHSHSQISALPSILPVLVR